MSIDHIVSTLALSERRPDAAVRAALANREAVVARTVDIIDRFVAAGDAYEDAITEDESMAFAILIHICGELRDVRVHRPLMRLLACEEGKVDWLLGDLITESIPGLLISTYDGTPQAIIELMEDCQAYVYCRDSAFRAWTWLAAKEVWPKEETVTWLRAAFDTLQPRQDHHIWESWLDAVAVLGLDDLVPLVDIVFAETRFGEYEFLGTVSAPIERADFDGWLQNARNARDLDAWLRERHLCPADDTITELSGWHCYSRDTGSAPARAGEVDGWHRIQRDRAIVSVRFGPDDTIT